MGGAGAAGNRDMLEGAEGQVAYTALAQALAACSSLQTLHLGSECGRCWEGIAFVMRDASVYVRLPPHLHRTCVRGTARVCMCVCLDGCVCMLHVYHTLSFYTCIHTSIHTSMCVSCGHTYTCIACVYSVQVYGRSVLCLVCNINMQN